MPKVNKASSSATTFHFLYSNGGIKMLTQEFKNTSIRKSSYSNAGALSE